MMNTITCLLAIYISQVGWIRKSKHTILEKIFTTTLNSFASLFGPINIRKMGRNGNLSLMEIVSIFCLCRRNYLTINSLRNMSIPSMKKKVGMNLIGILGIYLRWKTGMTRVVTKLGIPILPNKEGIFLEMISRSRKSING